MIENKIAFGTSLLSEGLAYSNLEKSPFPLANLTLMAVMFCMAYYTGKKLYEEYHKKNKHEFVEQRVRNPLEDYLGG